MLGGALYRSTSFPHQTTPKLIKSSSDGLKHTAPPHSLCNS